MNIKKCQACKICTLKDSCPKCNKKTTSPSYKFPKIKNAPPRSKLFKRK